MRKILLIISTLLLITSPVYAAAPILYFSDMTDAPTTGWEGSGTKGAAVTIWGNNFGSSRGSSTVTVCGVTLNTDADFPEWGLSEVADGTGTDYSAARGLQRITFYLNSSMATGTSTISVTTSEGTSATVPFYCRALGSNHIYYISTTGNDSNTGLSVAQAWANPNKLRMTPVAGDVIYFKAGTYNHQDAGPSYTTLYFNQYAYPHPNGTSHQNSISVSSYPGEIAQWGDNTITNVINHYTSGGGEHFEYWTFSKFKLRANDTVIGFQQGPDMHDEGLRFVGNDYGSYGFTSFGWQAGCSTCTSSDFVFYGNHGHDSGRIPRGAPYNNQKAYAFYFNVYGQQDGGYVGWNEFDNNWQDPNDGSCGRGIQLYGHETTDRITNIYIHDNWIHDNSCQGAILGGGDPGTPYPMVGVIYFYNNVMWNSGYNSILVTGQGGGNIGGTWYIWNNTFHDSGGVIDVTTAATPTLIDIRNNIFWGDSNNGDAAYYQGKTGSFFNRSYNVYYGLGNGPTGETGKVDADPLFVNGNPAMGKGASPPAGYLDFRIQTSSPAKNAGTPSVNSLVTRDFIGITRPQESAYDIGAFEYASGATGTTWTVSVSYGSGGTLSCNSPVNDGSTTNCTASPSNGYHTSGISGCGGSWTSGNSYTTGSITVDCTVTATFAGNASTVAEIKKGRGATLHKGRGATFIY